MAGMFKGIEKPEVRASRDSNYFRRGHYLLRIDKVKADETRQGKAFIAIETTVLHTFPDGDGRDFQGDLEQGDYQWSKPGSTPSQLLMLAQDTFLPNVKAFVCNMMGVPESKVDEAACEDMCADDNPMGGMVAEVQNRTIKTRAGNDFTKVNWVREWLPSEYSKVVDVKLLETFFPNLEELLEAEAG